jgi:membrane associated rhomboid family serine protease
MRPNPPRPPAAVLSVIVVCCAIEAGLTLLGSTALGMPGLRNAALVLGAFWPGLLGQWDPIWPGQPVLMFFTHAFLHGGLLHLIMNMLVLAHLGRETAQRLGQWGFVLVYMLCAAAGGGMFALVSSAPGPMVGASGAIFGLFGLTQFWEWQTRRALGADMGPVWRTTLGLVVMNVVLWALTGGYLAWEAHLGGWVAGVALGMMVTPTPHHRIRR